MLLTRRKLWVHTCRYSYISHRCKTKTGFIWSIRSLSYFYSVQRQNQVLQQSKSWHNHNICINTIYSTHAGQYYPRLLFHSCRSILSETNTGLYLSISFYTPRNEVVGRYTGFTMSVRPSICRQILCRTITWVVFLRIF